MFAEAVRGFRTLRPSDLPTDATRVAGHCLLDWLGCALAGSREPLAAILREEMTGDGPCSIIGTPMRAGPRSAALVNGAAGHALDFDDTHTAMNGHPSVPIAPAVLALAEELGVSREEMLTAFVVGVEVACRLGLYVGAEHYRRGWHATGTLGTVGAAAASAHLMQLDEERWGHALGLAATQAAGLKASFGTMAKPLHAGKAASDGLLAARLASRGFTGNPEAVDADQGFAEAAAGNTCDPDRLAQAEGRFLVADTLFKYHAACYLTHAAINAASLLRDGSDPAAVELRVHPSLLGVCAIPEPTTGLELKFSLRGTTAMALLGIDTSDQESFTDGQARDPRLVALRDKVTVTTDGSLPATRVIVTVDGREADDDTGVPATDLDLQEKRLVAKFLGLARPVVGDEAAQALAKDPLSISLPADLKAVRSGR